MKGLAGVALLLAAFGAAADERAEALADYSQGRLAQAGARLEVLLKRSPQDAELQYALGRAKLEQGQAEAALPPLREAVRLALGNAEYHYRLGLALATHINNVSFFKKMGIAGEIKAAFLQAVAINPDFLDAREALMTFYLTAPGVAGGSEDKAREQAREIKQRDPVRGYLADARLLLREEETFDQAIAAYKVAIEAAPDKTDARFELGLALQERKRYEEAMEQFNGAIQRKPEESRAYYQIGKAAVLSKAKLDLGEKGLKRYLELGPQRPGDPSKAAAHWRLGMVYEAQSRKDVARVQYETALRLDPDMKEAKASLAALK